MPEGDTVHKIARAMQPHLEGQRVAALWLRQRGEVAALAGAVVEEVAALGKHFLFAIGPRHVLHVHLGMGGKWFRFAPGEAWARSPATAAVRLETAAWRFVCFRAPVAELLRRIDLAAHPILSRLGPDLLAPELDLGHVVARARRRSARTAADLLLDQRVACGIGNVYKSEVLFAEAVHPWTAPGDLPDAAVHALYATARRLLGQNLGGWRRTTVRPVRDHGWPPDLPRVFVYGRGGQPCLRCAGRVASRLQGDDARATYWCPRCQPPASRQAGATGWAGAGTVPDSRTIR